MLSCSSFAIILVFITCKNVLGKVEVISLLIVDET